MGRESKMETLEIEIYEFHELDDEAKNKARDWYREGLEYFWFDDAMRSIHAFASHFGAKVSDYEIGGYRGNDHIKTDITQDHFRGLKLKDINPEHSPTGYCVDFTLWKTFHSEWKRTSDPMYAFEQALEAAISDIQADIEYQYSDESVEDNIRCNEYKFTSDGKFWG
jgi:hypothetical protein